ncbi:MAG: 50S ribosomal protein L3 [Candidatus Marinimicrobia bacterium]|jgi:large subunit ribosomal protein L3|nr:50S ribosomal protein L3 [Candidatus Neomarinimicrobiota bacterium]
MMRGLIGKKVGMTQIYDEQGIMTPVTVVEAGPCVVTQIKTKVNDGYDAVQVGYGDRKKKHLTKPMEGHFARAKVDPKRLLVEFDILPGFEYKLGQEFTVSLFKTGEYVDVSGKSKGRGFAGVIKRHNFSTQPKTHGTKNTYRHPGSIGQASDPARVFKGMKMAGHYGNAKITLPNVKIVQVDKEKNQILLKGPVPGANNGIVYIVK